MPNLHLTTSGGQTVDLWQIQEDRDERDGMVDVAAMPTFDSEETYLSGMTEVHNTSISGIATGNRLSNQSQYSSDSVTALAEWVQEVMALVDGKQGTGYSLTHDERGLDVNVILESFAWTRSGGERFQIEWDLEYQIGEGIMVNEEPTPNEANPSTSWSLDGRDLQSPIQYREEKRQRLETDEMLFAESAEENVISDQSSPIRTVTINGRHKGTRSERQAFDQHFRNLIGQDNIVTYQSAFPGHSLDVMVNKYESVLEAGRTRVGEYTLELIEGTNST